MPNALMPDTSSYADPTGNALLAKGWDPNAAAQSSIATQQGLQGLQMNSQVMQLRNAQISQEQLKLGQQKLSALNGVLGGLITNPTPDNATSQIGWAVQNGVIDPDSATKAAGEIAALGGDPQKIKAWATDHLNQNAQHQQLMDQAYGTPGMLSNGAVSSPVVTKQGAGAGVYPAAGPNVVQQLSPGEASAPQPGPVNPDGSPTQTTRGAAVQRQGGLPATVDPFGRIAYPNAGQGGAPAGPAAAPASPPVSFGGPAPAPATTQGGAQSSAPSSGSAPASATWTPSIQTMPAVTADQANAALARTQAGTGTAADRNLMRAYLIQTNHPLSAKGAAFEPQSGQAPQPAGQGGGQAGAPAPAAPAGAAPAPITVGLAPGVAEAKTAMGVQGANRLDQIRQEASTGPDQMASLNNLEAQLGKVSTGPLAGRINLAKSSYNQVAGMAGLPQIDPQGVAAYDEIHKSAAQLAGAAAQVFGSGTNDKLALAIAQNPSAAISNMSNQQVIPLIKGMIAAKQVKAEAANAYVTAHGNDPSTVGAFETDWNKNASPRAFQFAYMTPQQRSDLYQSLQPAEQKQLVSAVGTAEQRGWIKSGAGQ